MNTCATNDDVKTGEALPEEWLALKERVRRMPPSVRAELEPMVDEALEEARFRGRVLSVARDALEQLHHDLKLTRFDLDMTRREREKLRQMLEEVV